MDRDVEEAVGALLARRQDAIRDEYEDQDLVVEYAGETYDSLDALADDLTEDAPGTAGTIAYDDIGAVLDGDAVYHELLHDQAFTAERPASEAVARMRMEAEDRTSAARGGDDAGGGLHFHVEEEPFIAVWPEDDGVRYAAVQVIPEARSASCRRTKITYPGKVFAVTGTVDDIPGPDAFIAEREDRRGEPEPSPDDATEAPRDSDPEDGLVCGVGADQPPVPEDTPDTDTPEADATLEEVYAEVFGEPDTFGYDEYEAVMLEAADNLGHMRSALNTMLKYVNAYRIESADAELPEGAATESTDFYAERLDDHIDRVTAVNGAPGHESLPRAVYATSESIRHILAEETAGYRERFRTEQTDAYEQLHAAHPATPASTSDILKSFAPDRDEVNPAHPVVLLSTFTMGGRDALDTHLDQLIDPDPDTGRGGGAGFEGNETTDGMFQ